MNDLFAGGKDSWHKWWNIWGTTGIWEGYEEGHRLLQGMNVRSHDPQSMFIVGHMTHNESTCLLNFGIIWSAGNAWHSEASLTKLDMWKKLVATDLHYGHWLIVL